MSDQTRVANSEKQPAARRAVIDIGTNSVKLLVGDVAGALITPVFEGSRQTRLGAGFYDDHRLKPEAIAKTAEAVAAYAGQAAAMGARSVRVIATSAARDARNSSELVTAIERMAKLQVQILSGDEEARWVFHGVMTDSHFSKHSSFLIDLGGGSTEIILGRNGKETWAKSFEVGAVRLLEKLSPPDPPGLNKLRECRVWLKEFLRREVVPEISTAFAELPEPVQFIGVGGTATILVRIEAQMEDFDRERIEAAHVPFLHVRTHLELQWEMTLAERRKIIGLPPNRADVILTGMAIYEAIMEEFGFDELRVSTRGLRYFALLGHAAAPGEESLPPFVS